MLVGKMNTNRVNQRRQDWDNLDVNRIESLVLFQQHQLSLHLRPLQSPHRQKINIERTKKYLLECFVMY